MTWNGPVGTVLPAPDVKLIFARSAAGKLWLSHRNRSTLPGTPIHPGSKRAPAPTKKVAERQPLGTYSFKGIEEEG